MISKGGRMDAGRRRDFGQGFEGAGHHPLAWQRAILDERRRGVCAAAVADHGLAVGLQHAYAHVDHRGLARPGEGRPVEGGFAGTAVAGGKHHRLGVIPVGERNAGIGTGTRKPR
jgi:hypothetical protein